jgi:serine/threonine-protein kinase
LFYNPRETMALTIGTQLGSHEITALLGKGGMGEVYRARDLKLKREVAIKVLPDEFAGDADRVARFQREAEALASLNHPNIGAIYDLEDVNGSLYLVLELVEGETLSERIERGALPVEEALDIARNICEALEAAHEKGIVHRDLKPANVKITPDGKVKVLDFGLAKAMEGTPAPAMLSNSPTLVNTMAGTQAGFIIGTAAYMSPEQARGFAADQRSDVFSFGCVVYEMLTGRQAFQGETVSDILAAILARDPDFGQLPGNLNPKIADVLRRSLEKNRKRRWHSIADVRIEIEQALSQPIQPESAAAGLSAPAKRKIMVASSAFGVLGGVLITALVIWALSYFSPAKPARPVRFDIIPPAAQAFLPTAGDEGQIRISPNGDYVVYRMGIVRQGPLVVRMLDQLDGRPLPGTEGSRYPFISPDGRWVGFFKEASLRKTSLTGGSPLTLSNVSGPPRGASWGDDDNIIFGSADRATGLMSVPSGGGEAKVLIKADAASGEAAYAFPFVLPGAHAVLFTIVSTGQAVENSKIAVLDLKTREKKILIRGGTYAQYFEPGYIVYAAGSGLRSVRFDARRLEIQGDPVPVLENVSPSQVTGAANFAVSRSGAIIYVTGGPGGEAPQRPVVWIDRHGREEPAKVPPRVYAHVRIAPDGARVAFEARDQENDIWIWDLMRRTFTRLTLDPGLDQLPLWTPDSRRVIFSSQSGGGAGNLYRQAADNTSPPERLTTDADLQRATSISRDGKYVVFTKGQTGIANDIGILTLDDKRKTEVLIRTPRLALNGEISPDNHWIAYQSNESGQFEVYVRPFPNVNAGRVPISVEGGSRPLWAHNGHELFYFEDKSGNLMTVPYRIVGDTFIPGIPTKLFEVGLLTNTPFRAFDVTPDDQRFVVIKETTFNQASTTSSAAMIVVLNWSRELQERIPLK